jgi:hypothetical protein
MSDPNVDPAKPFDGHANPDLAQAIPILTAIAGLTKTTADDKIVGIAGSLLSNPGTGGIIAALFSFISGLFHQHAKATAPAPATQPAPVSTVVTTVVTSPATPAPAAASPNDEPATLKAKLFFVELPPRVTGKPRGSSEENFEGRERYAEILAGANIHSDSWIHTNCSPFAADGTEIATGDPRWAAANRWAPNGCPIWLYYEWNGQSTLEGHHSENVEPGSVEDDMGCTPTYKVKGPGKFRFGFQYRKHDGTMVDSGLIGQGNQPGGEPFNISAG